MSISNIIIYRATQQAEGDDQLDTLPAKVSYSAVALTNGNTLLRRDLFDARFQLASEDSEDRRDPVEAPLGYTASRDAAAIRRPDEAVAGVEQDCDEVSKVVDADSDLIPGLYEGGLKTWEGGMDLVDVLSDVPDISTWVQGSRILEVSFDLSWETG